MQIRTRLKLGFCLMALSAVTFVILNIVVISKGHVVGIGNGSVGNRYWMATETKLDINTHAFDLLYLVPIILCGTLGLLCLLWPQRKPPKL